MGIHVYHELSFALLSRYYLYVNKLDLIHWDIVFPLSHRFRVNVTGRNSRKKRLPCSKHFWLPFSILWNYPPATHPKKGSISMAIDRTNQENMISPYTSRHSKMHSVSAMDGSQTDYQVTAPVGASSPCLQLFNGRLPLNSSQSDPRCDSSTAFQGLHKCRGGTTSPTTDHIRIYSHIGQPMWKSTSWDSMSRFKASGGAIGNAHIFMRGCSTHRRQPIAPKASQWATDAMRKKREGPTRRELSKWSTNLWHQFSCPP